MCAQGANLIITGVHLTLNETINPFELYVESFLLSPDRQNLIHQHRLFPFSHPPCLCWYESSQRSQAGKHEHAVGSLLSPSLGFKVCKHQPLNASRREVVWEATCCFNPPLLYWSWCTRSAAACLPPRIKWNFTGARLSGKVSSTSIWLAPIVYATYGRPKTTGLGF